MNPSSPTPFISIVIRSYNRLSYVLELVEICLNQDYDNYEVVIVEQSDKVHWEKYKETFNVLDSKVRVLRTEPRGSAAARNFGAIAARGDVLLLMDDDDLPVENNWISLHARHYSDPLCIGVSGRCVRQVKNSAPYKNMQNAYDRCLTYSFFLRGWDFTSIDKVKKPVQWLHGLNSSIRKSYVLNLGGWYPHIFNFDEHSFCFKLRKALKPDEYLMFDPDPLVRRRHDIPGGLEKRYQPLRNILNNQLLYYHRVVAYHYPVRFYVFYPLFMMYAFKYVMRWFRRFSYYEDSIWFKWFNKKNARRICFIQEFFYYPILVLSNLFKKRPLWDGPLIKYDDPDN